MSEREAGGLKTVTRRLRTEGKTSKYRVGDVVAFGEALVRRFSANDNRVTRYGRDDVAVADVLRAAGMTHPHALNWTWKPRKLAAMYCPAWAARRFGRIVSVEPRDFHPFSLADEVHLGEAKREGFVDCAEWQNLWRVIHGPGSTAEGAWFKIWRVEWVTLSRTEAFAEDAKRRAA